MAAEIDPDFLSILFGEDELGMVVRAHIHVEAALNQLLDVLAPFPDHLPRLRYEQRVNLACALGLAHECAPPLKKLGDIRNSFGHSVDTTLTVETTIALFNSFSEPDRQTLLKGFARTRQEVLPDLDANFTQLRPRDQFVLAAVALKRMLEQTIEDARKANAA